MGDWVNTPAGKISLDRPVCNDRVYEWCWHAAGTYGPVKGHDMHMSHEMMQASYDLGNTSLRIGAMAFAAAQAVLYARLPWPIMVRCRGLVHAVASLGASIVCYAAEGLDESDVKPLVKAGGHALAERFFERRKLAENGEWYDEHEFRHSSSSVRSRFERLVEEYMVERATPPESEIKGGGDAAG